MAKILVVDDEAAIRELLREAFGREGYEVVTIPTAEQAMAVIVEEPFDLVVFGEIAEYMKGNENHAVYTFGNEPDVLKYAAMKAAKAMA